MAKLKCPSETTLRLFNDGQLSATDIDLIAHHLDQCAYCLSRVDNIEAGPLEMGMRQAASAELKPEGDDDSRIDSSAQRVLDSVFPDIPETNVSHRGCDLYRLVKHIGTVAMGEVYCAADLVMDQSVTIVIPDESLIASVDHRAQLKLDGNNASYLKHENILRVFQFGNWDEDQFFFAMPEVAAMSLASVVRHEVEFDLAGVLEVLGQICHAVRYAHRHNVLHRHLDPTNIYIGADLHVLVAEFGLVIDGRYQFGLIEPLVSSTRFNSPEAIRNEPKRIDVRTDIFSIGAILDLLLELAQDVDEENFRILKEISRKCQRTSRKKRFQRIEHLIDEIGERVCAGV